MTDSNRRLADRIPVGILAELETLRGHLAAQIRDLSRTGLRLRVPAAELELDGVADADDALEAIQQQVRPRFHVSLNHDRLGSLLQRKVTLTRVELPSETMDELDLCCRFAEPLTDEESQLLESYLPPVKARAEPETGRVVGGVRLHDTGSLSVPRPDGRPRQRYRAFVSTNREGTVQTFRCHTDLVTAIGVRIAVPRSDYGDDVKAAASIFARRYGTHLDLRVSDEDIDVWRGRVRVSGVELPPHREQVMLVTLSFDRPLALIELRSLGLLGRVA